MRILIVILASACFLQWTMDGAIAGVTAKTALTCKIRDKQTCQSLCSAPSSCKSDCVGCPSSCGVECWDIVWPNDGINKLWKGFSHEQRHLFMKGMKIEGE
jgi:hypothetical protein